MIYDSNFKDKLCKKFNISVEEMSDLNGLLYDYLDDNLSNDILDLNPKFDILKYINISHHYDIFVQMIDSFINIIIYCSGLYTDYGMKTKCIMSLDIFADCVDKNYYNFFDEFISDQIIDDMWKSAISEINDIHYDYEIDFIKPDFVNRKTF